MRILVTGGAGFIGSAVVRYLVLEKGDDVLNIDALTYAGNLESLREVQDHPRYRFLHADIADSAAVTAAVESFQPERILHLAGESHVDRSIHSAADFLHTNVIGTFTMLQAALSYWRGLPSFAQEKFRFLHASTDEVFGSLGNEGQFTEATAYDPSSPYSASKAASDHFVRAWGRTYGLPVVVSNCSNNYGPYQFPEKLVPLMILNALNRRPLPIYGTGQNVRDWLYVNDHVKALDMILDHGRVGETYNVGGRNERRNVDVVRKICAALDRVAPADHPYEELITFVQDRPGHDARYAIDATKLEQEIGWRPEHDFESGIEETVRWYLDNRWWWESLLDRPETASAAVKPLGTVAAAGR